VIFLYQTQREAITLLISLYMLHYATQMSQIHELLKQRDIITACASNFLAAQNLHKARNKLPKVRWHPTHWYARSNKQIQMQTLLHNNVIQTASENLGANHRVTANPFVPSGPRGCRTMLSLDEHFLLLVTASQLLLCPNLHNKLYQ